MTSQFSFFQVSLFDFKMSSKFMPYPPDWLSSKPESSFENSLSKLMVSLKIQKGFEPIVFFIDGISSCYVVSISPQKEVTTLQHSRLENVPLGSIHKQRSQFGKGRGLGLRFTWNLPMNRKITTWFMVVSTNWKKYSNNFYLFEC